MAQALRHPFLLVFAASTAMASTWYVSPTGAGAKDGKSIATAFATPGDGVAAAKAGDTILLSGGTYTFTAPLKITTSGTATAPICLFAENAYTKRADFDFRKEGYGSSNQGIILSGSYWHFKGIDEHNAGDNGMQITGGSNNVIEW